MKLVAFCLGVVLFSVSVGFIFTKITSEPAAMNSLLPTLQVSVPTYPATIVSSMQQQADECQTLEGEEWVACRAGQLLDARQKSVGGIGGQYKPIY